MQKYTTTSATPAPPFNAITEAVGSETVTNTLQATYSQTLWRFQHFHKKCEMLCLQ